VISCFGMKALLLLTLAFFSTTIGAFAQNSETPRGWKQVTACDFTFLVPDSTRALRTSPIDSCLAAFDYNGIEISLDYGWYSAPLGESYFERPDSRYKNHRREKISIAGRDAELIHYDDMSNPKKTLHVTQVHIITSQSDRSSMIVSLLMSFETNKDSDADIIRQIYESVRFLGKEKW
jgi:hypothetical protein